MGSDGDKVRGTIERDFSKYLDERAKERRKEGFQAAALGLLLSVLRPVGTRAGRQVAERLMNPDEDAFQEQLQRIRERRASIGKDKGAGAAEGGGPGSGVGI
jgi:hypothetical protein